MKCDNCKNRTDCLVAPELCSITCIDDDSEAEGMSHPTEIEFELTSLIAKFIGDQLLVWVPRSTLKALASMRKVDFAGTDAEHEGELQGYMDEASICFLTITPEVHDQLLRERGFNVMTCPSCNCKAAFDPKYHETYNCHKCGTKLH